MLLGLAAPASADPTGCLGGGYNPTALSNVCTGSSPGQTLYTGTVGTAPGPCVIGQTCVPVPTYDPNGGTPLPVPSVPNISYADVHTDTATLTYDNGHLLLVTDPDVARCVYDNYSGYNRCAAYFGADSAYLSRADDGSICAGIHTAKTSPGQCLP